VNTKWIFKFEREEKEMEYIIENLHIAVGMMALGAAVALAVGCFLKMPSAA